MKLTALLLAASTVAAGCAATTNPQSLPWLPCAENAAAECTTLTVPVDWTKRKESTVDIAVVRRKAADPARRVGVLVYAPAGPGSSGVDAIAQDQQFSMMFTAEIAARFDVVSLDPRGVRRSHPVVCDGKLFADQRTPWDQAGFDARRAANAVLGNDCRARTGPLFDHIASTDMARDVDALREALGEATINLYGLSYGTVLGQMYAELFPKRIRTMVLDANVDHSTNTEQDLVVSARGAQDSFNEFVAWCARETECALHGRDVRAMLAELRDKAAKGTLVEPGTTTKVEPDRLIHSIITPLSIPRRNVTAQRIASLAGIGKPGPAPADSPPPAISPLAIAISCADNEYGIRSFQQLTAARGRAAAVAPDVGRGAYGPTTLCLDWPGKTTNPNHRTHAPDAPPILVTNSRHDPSTPHESAVSVASQLRSAVLVTYEGAGHGAYRRSECMQSLVDRYFVDRAVPARGTTCPA
ncbi:alpha/beta hydrolase [Allokutzneria sp. A3M-2-11 16]|uniref:alpha/beta hydrolase n=1 Tax=Allokutzneria sp. A3M-2-11 16 TaxID=2962043 RepID=UPI0020B8FB89|nr:alpha/beta hydrolase [Allokutzneria sp. A3M-2-11 16]MCP3805041.1 alpha/beta hydrolase [Allokutzneria sp. A3M-2-11 16]